MTNDDNDPLEDLIADLKHRAAGRVLAQELSVAARSLDGPQRSRALLDACLVLHELDDDDDTVFSTIDFLVNGLTEDYLGSVVHQRGETEASPIDIDHPALMAVSLFVLGFDAMAASYVHDRSEYDRRVAAGQKRR